MSFDINAAIEAYSHSMGNRPEELAEYCAEQGVAERETEIRAAIEAIQGDVFDMIWEKTRVSGPMSAAEIETLASQHCQASAPEVDESGVRSLLRWIVWMAWHEGCMK